MDVLDDDVTSSSSGGASESDVEEDSQVPETQAAAQSDFGNTFKGMPEDGHDGMCELPSVDHLLLDGPVAREVNHLQLQIDELLRELRFEDKNRAVAQVIEQLEQIIRNIPDQDVPASAVQSFLDVLPLTSQRPLNFRRPSTIKVTGAFANQTVVLPECTVNVTVTIPSTCFLQKDHLNHQYHVRRAMYLVAISKALQKDKVFRDQQWIFQIECMRKPVLMVTPKLKSGDLPSGLKIRILTQLEQSTFALTKLAPDRNNLRSVCTDNKNSNGEPELLPTPQYNATILEDIFPNASFHALRRASSQLPQFLNASLLLKVWARQQGLQLLCSGPSEDLLPIFAAHLAQAEKLIPAMTSVQIFRTVLKAFADPKTFRNGVFMKTEEHAESPKPPAPAMFKAKHQCVFVDPGGWLNIMAHFSKSSVHLMQQQAEKAVACLEKLLSAEEAFEVLFLAKRPAEAAFDYFWRVSLPEEPSNQLSSDLPSYRAWELQVEELARKALADRARLVHAFPRPMQAKASLATPCLQHSTLLLAAKADVAHAFRTVDRGPASDSQEAAAFKEFWDGKSEMRKFLDGRICEALPWAVKPSARHTVMDEIIQYILPRHLGVRVQGSSTCMDWSLECRNCERDDQLTTRRKIDAVLVKLGKSLRSLSSLPLKIISLLPIGVETRHTSPFSPLPHPFVGGYTSRGAAVARCVTPLECLLQFEGSGKWPDNVEAFAKMKAALAVQIAKELFTTFGMRVDCCERFLDIFTDGFVFRMFIFSERDKAVALKDRSFAVAHNEQQNRLKHHGMMTQLAGIHPTLRATTELALRWTASQLMSNHVPKEAVELVVAATFSGLGSYPGSPQAGLMAFLRLLAMHAWSERPLVVDPDGEMDAARRQACLSTFQRAKEEGIAPAMPIATSVDPASAHWTVSRPSSQVRQRLVALARRSLATFEAQLWDMKSEASKGSLMRAWDPALADFDAVIMLRTWALPSAGVALRVAGRKRRLTDDLLPAAGFLRDEPLPGPPKQCKAVLQLVPSSVVKEWGSLKIMQELVVGFEPVEIFVTLLQQRFGHLATFFFDEYGGNVVAIKWTPQAFVAQPAIAESAHTSMPTSQVIAGDERPKKRTKLKHPAERLMCVPDLLRIIADIQELGAGLVSEICLKEKPK